MTEEEKPTIKKVVVKKVVKKVAPAKSTSQVTNSSQPVVKTISGAETKTINTSIATAKTLKPKVSSDVKSKTATKPVESQSTKLLAKPNAETVKSPMTQPLSSEAAKTKKRPVVKQNKKSSKLPLILIALLLLGVAGGTAIFFNKPGQEASGNSNKQGGGGMLPFINNLLPVANASLILPQVGRLSERAPIWVHLVNSAGDAEALKNGPSKALNAYKELKEASPFVIFTPVPPKEGWLKPGKMKELAAEIQTIIKNQKCDASRLVISGEGVGTTAALILAGELNGAVGAVLVMGTPSEEAFSEIDKFRYVPLRFLAPASDKDAVGWAHKIAGDLRASGCAVTVTEISPSPNLISGAWGAPELWAWMVTRKVADANTRAGIDSLLAWSSPKPPPGVSLTAKPVVIDESQTVKGAILGEYFDGTAFNKKILERMDKSINIPERTYQLPENKADNLSVRWTGLLKIEKEGVYTFFSASDDGQKVLVGGVPVVDDWADHGVTEKTGTIKLAVGWYNFVVEHYQGGGGASIVVSWQGPGFDKKIIGEENLYTLKQKQGKQ